MPSVNELDEFRKQYCDTVVRLRDKREGGTFYPVFVRSEAHQIEDHLLIDHSKFGAMNLKWKSKTYEWLLDPPKKGLFNFNGTVGLFIRLPKRQWKRGLCTGTGHYHWITYPWRYGINKVTIPQVNLWRLPLVQALFNRDFRPWEQVIGDLLTYRSSEEALSPEFAVTLSPYEKDDNTLLLWYEDQIVGELYPQVPGVLIRQAIFGQEIRDFMKRIKLPWPVKFL